MQNNIKQPINSVIYFGRKFNNILPEKTDTKETSSEIINKIIVLQKEIFLFLIPYVTPIPSESMLLEIAKTKQLKREDILDEEQTENLKKNISYLYVACTRAKDYLHIVLGESSSKSIYNKLLTDSEE